MRSNARASTLRTTIGFETLSYEGFSVLVEAEYVAVIDNDVYNSAEGGSSYGEELSLRSPSASEPGSI